MAKSLRVFALQAVVAAVLFSGCRSYRLVQRNVFSDEDGNLVTVDYGVADRDHVNTFIAPNTGKELEFKSRLVVDVELPNGDDITAWQCMNLRSRGTLYRTDDNRWQVLVNGFTCLVYRKTDEDRNDYAAVYRGVLCDSPQIEVKKDERWKVVPVERKNYVEKDK